MTHSNHFLQEVEQTLNHNRLVLEIQKNNVSILKVGHTKQMSGEFLEDSWVRPVQSPVFENQSGIYYRRLANM